MKKVVYYTLCVVTFILLIPCAVILTIVHYYMLFVRFLITKPTHYCRDAVKMPKWFELYCNYIDKLLGL